MMDHSEQLLDIMDSSFLEHKDGALNHHNSMSYHMDGVGNLTSGSPLLTSNNGNAYVPYSFLGHDDLSPSSPLTDHSSSDNDIPLSPQSDHPFSEALGGSALFLPPPCVPLVTTPNVSSSSLPLSSRSLVSLPIINDNTAAISSSIVNDGKQRKRKAATSVSVTSTKSNSRSKGRRTDSKKEASSAAIKTSSSNSSNNSNNTSTTKMAASIPTPTSKPSSIRTTRSGSRAAAAATSPLVPVHGCDEDKTSIVTPLSTNNDASPASSSSSSMESNGLSLPSLEAIPDHNGILATPPHMMAAMGNLAVMGAVTLAQPEYERMLAEEERTKEKKMRKAEQARISRQKKKDRMTLLEESVAMYKQQIAHLQSLPAAASASATASSPNVPTPVGAAERKSAISPVWQRSSTSSGSSSNDGNGNNDDTRSVQSGDDSSSSSSGSSITAASPMHAPAVAVTVPVIASSSLAVTKEATTDIVTPMLTPVVAAPPVVVEDEVNGEAIQRCIQTIITSSYPAANAAASPNGASLSSYGLMATGSVHGSGVAADSKDGQSSSAVDTLNNNIQGLFDMFAKRAHATESHLESLDKLLVPSMPLRFLEWSLTQNEKFYSDPNGLWHCLWSKTLSLTTEQMTSLASLRSDVVAQRTAEAEIRMQALNMTGIVVGSTPSITTTSNDGTAATATSSTTFPVTSISPRSLSLSSTLSLQAAYSQLSALSRLHLAASNRWLRTLATILTPLQVARYFEWVNIYGHICVQINI